MTEKTSKSQRLAYFSSLYQKSKCAAEEKRALFDRHMQQYRGSAEIDGSTQKATTVRNIIEVDPLPNGEFPKPEEAKAEINIITAYDSLVKKYYVFSKNEYSG